VALLKYIITGPPPNDPDAISESSVKDVSAKAEPLKDILLSPDSRYTKNPNIKKKAAPKRATFIKSAK
jgi:hypothetical protein